MRYWFDTEFLEAGPDQPIYLLSLGVVAEDGREFYGVNADCPIHRANAWVKQHVLPRLAVETAEPRSQIRTRLLEFVTAGGGKPEFWAYYADYDWVVLCQLFGTMADLPRGWPMYCRDLKQLADSLGNPRLPEQGKGEHHALADARWNRQVWAFLQGGRWNVMPNHKLLSVERATDRQRRFGHLSLGALLDRCVAEARDPAFLGRDPTRTAAELVAGYLIAFYDQRDAETVGALTQLLNDVRNGISEPQEFSEV